MDYVKIGGLLALVQAGSSPDIVGTNKLLLAIGPPFIFLDQKTILTARCMTWIPNRNGKWQKLICYTRDHMQNNLHPNKLQGDVENCLELRVPLFKP